MHVHLSTTVVLLDLKKQVLKLLMKSHYQQGSKAHSDKSLNTEKP